MTFDIGVVHGKYFFCFLGAQQNSVLYFDFQFKYMIVIHECKPKYKQNTDHEIFLEH